MNHPHTLEHQFEILRRCYDNGKQGVDSVLVSLVRSYIDRIISSGDSQAAA